LIKNKDISPVQISYTDAETGAVDYFNLEMEYTPIIIDYGRSYINSDKAVSLTNQTFINHDKNKGYLSFKDMTEDLWPGQKFRHRERSILIRVQKMIESLSPKYDMDYLTILNNYFDATDNSIASGIDPKIFHPMYDAYRFTRTLSSHLVNACLNNMIHIDSMWFKLTRVLSDNYPFYVPYYFGLATVYPPFPSKAYSNYTCMRPFDIVYLCDLLKSNSIKYQIGGGGGKEPVLLKLNDNFKKQKMPVSPPDTLPPTDSVGKGTDNVAANLEGIDLLVVNDKPDFDVPLPTSSNYKFFSKTASFELQNALFQIPKNFFKKQN
jgi:hypothetical protein